MISLVGYTGFVGNNIYTSSEGSIEGLYNSQNICKAYDTCPDLLIYAGIRAEKYLANNNPEKDYEMILGAEKNIKRINPKKLILISTVDVFKEPIDVNELSIVDTDRLHPYGYNRYKLEEWVREYYPDALIVRLPSLFGNGIKKNFIYDYISVVPYMLNQKKYLELCEKDVQIEKYYKLQDNGFYRVDDNEKNSTKLKRILQSVGFTAEKFTDSRCQFQFYNLSRLWSDINIALDNGVKLLHLATEPILISDLYFRLSGKSFDNLIEDKPLKYDYKSIYCDIFNGKDGYLYDAETIFSEIEEFVSSRKTIK